MMEGSNRSRENLHYANSKALRLVWCTVGRRGRRRPHERLCVRNAHATPHAVVRPATRSGKTARLTPISEIISISPGLYYNKPTVSR